MTSFDVGTLLLIWPKMLAGLTQTLVVTSISFAGALSLGLFLMLLQAGGSRWGAWLARGYVSLFRVIPEMGVIFWTYYCLPIVLDLRLSELTCGIIALTLIAAAYTTEIFRAGYNSLPRGQVDAARALGLSTLRAWRFVLAPQILRRMTAPLINCGIDILKNSTLLAAIGAAELAYQAHQVGTATYDYLTPFTCVALVFFLIIFPLSAFARRRETSLQRSGR